MSELYKKRFRGYLIDNHSPAPPVISFGNLNIAEHADFFSTARIDSLMLYCKDHWGYSYYDTRIGQRHPALDRDWLAEVVAELRRQDIEFNAYYCIEYDNTITIKHPEWATRTADGGELRCGARNAKWRMPCYMTGYRGYVLGQLTEIVSAYRPDSLFLDIFGKSLCYCPACRDAFRRKTGQELPGDAAGIKLLAADIITFLDDCAEDFLIDVKRTVKDIDPTLAVTINFAAHYPKRIRDRLDYHFTEPWAGNWLSAAHARATGRHPQLGPGNVSSIYNYQSANVYVAAAAQIAAQGCRVFIFSEPQRPDGSLEREESARIGTAYREVGKFQHLLDNRRIIADIAIVQSDASVLVGTGGTVTPGAIGRTRAPNRHVTALLGAMQVCDYAKYGWTVVPEAELTAEALSAYRLVILPEVLALADDTWRRLLSFMQAGGTVLATGETGLHSGHSDDFIFAGATGIHFRGIRDEFATNQWGGYAGFVRQGVLAGLPDTTPPITPTSVRFDIVASPPAVSDTTTATIAVYIEPAVVVGPETWVNWGSPPPSRRTAEALIASAPIGSGRFWYAGFDLFGMAAGDAIWVKQYFPVVMGSHLAGATIRLLTDYPETISFTAYRRAGEYIVHIVSLLPTTNGGDAPPLPAGSLEMHSEHDLVAHEVYPDERPLACSRSGQTVAVDVGMVSIHKIIILRSAEAGQP
jgi:hypothetical protein